MMREVRSCRSVEVDWFQGSNIPERLKYPS